MAKQDAIPAGSQPPQEEITETKATSDNAEESEKLLGKFNSPEEMATSYKELESTLGRQGSELSGLRKQMEAMNEDRAVVEAETGQQMPDFAEMTTIIETKVEEGEISVSEGMAQMAEITQQQTAAQMEEKFAAYERGKEEALKIAKGADGTRSVLSKPGSSSRDVTKPQKGMNDSEKVSGMMSALAAVRG